MPARSAAPPARRTPVTEPPEQSSATARSRWTRRPRPCRVEERPTSRRLSTWWSPGTQMAARTPGAMLGSSCSRPAAGEPLHAEAEVALELGRAPRSKPGRRRRRPPPASPRCGSRWACPRHRAARPRTPATDSADARARAKSGSSPWCTSLTGASIPAAAHDAPRPGVGVDDGHRHAPGRHLPRRGEADDAPSDHDRRRARGQGGRRRPARRPVGPAGGEVASAGGRLGRGGLAGRFHRCPCAGGRYTRGILRGLQQGQCRPGRQPPTSAWPITERPE